MTGVDGEETQANNRASLERIYLRARRLVDVAELDTRVREARHAQALLRMALQCGCVDPLLCVRLEA